MWWNKCNRISPQKKMIFCDTQQYGKPDKYPTLTIHDFLTFYNNSYVSAKNNLDFIV
jgi:hypothetical protein